MPEGGRPGRPGAAGAEPGRPTVVVVGGGITGLAAAYELSLAREERTAPTVVLAESAGRVGGHLVSEPFADVILDTGPDAFVSRTPDALELCDELGLRDELVSPATGRALVWARGRLRPLPDGLVLGAPTKFVALALSGVLSPRGAARAAMEPVLPATARDGPDVTVASVITSRYGREVDEALVDPLVGGINAGSTSSLSLAAGAPRLDAAYRQGRSLARALAAGAGGSPGREPAGPLFYSLRGGIADLVESLRDALVRRGVEVRTSTPVESVERAGSPRRRRWLLSSRAGPAYADAVLLATPAPVAAKLLAACLPGASAELSGISYASVALVTLCYRGTAGSFPPDASGFLVPRRYGALTTACTFMTSKWPHLRRGTQEIVRLSIGRSGDERATQLGDDELARRARSELGELTGVRAEPALARVDRWPASFPQYTVGHLERLDRIAAEVAASPGLSVCGAAHEGLGIPSCIAQGRRAARSLLAQLDETRGS